MPDRRRTPPAAGTRPLQFYVDGQVIDRFKVWCAINRTSMTKAVATFMAEKAATVTLPGDPPAKPPKKVR